MSVPLALIVIFGIDYSSNEYLGFRTQFDINFLLVIHYLETPCLTHFAYRYNLWTDRSNILLYISDH